jgi:hypothetical protein
VTHLLRQVNGFYFLSKECLKLLFITALSSRNLAGFFMTPPNQANLITTVYKGNSDGLRLLNLLGNSAGVG